MEELDKQNSLQQNQETSSIVSEEAKISSSSSLGKIAERFRYELLSKRMLDDFSKQQKEVNDKNRKFQEEQFKINESKYKEDIENKSRDLEDKIENSKLSVIETIGMFVAFFTFISVDFQIFRSYKDPLIIGALTSILLGSIFLFIIVFDYFILQARKIRKTEENLDQKLYVEDKRSSRARKILIVLCSLFIIGGLVVFAVVPNKLDEDKEQIKREILDSLQKDLDAQKKDLEIINNANGAIIKDTNDSIKEFKRCINNFGFTYKCFKE